MKSSVKSCFVMFLMAVLIVGSLGACSSGNSNTDSGGKKKIEFWTIALQPTFNKYFNDLIAKYEKEHKNIDIVWKDYPYDAIESKLLTSIASDEAPSVVNLNTLFANQIGTKGALLDFNKKLTQEQKDVYFEGIYSSTEIDGKAYALPWYTGISVLFMNKELIKKAGLDPGNPPKTRAEMNEWGKTIKEKTGKYGYVFTMEARSIVEDGYQLVSDDHLKAAFNNDRVKKYIQGNVELMNQGIIPKDVLKFDQQVQMFGSQQVAMIISSSSFINQIKTSSPDVYKNMVAVPSPVGEADIRYSNTMNLAVPEKTKNKKEAVDFALYVTNADNQLAFSKVASTLPSAVESAKNPFFSKNDQSIEGQALAASVNSLDKATDFYLGISNSVDVASTVTKHLQNIYMNNKDIDRELKTAEEEVNKDLNK